MDSSLMEERNMLINLALSYIEDQHKVELSRSFVVFPKKTAFKGSKEGLEKSFMKKYQNEDGIHDEKFQNDLTELEKSFGPLAEGCKDTLLAKLANMDEPRTECANESDQNSDKSLLDQLTNITLSDNKETPKRTNRCSHNSEKDQCAKDDNLSHSKPKIEELNDRSSRTEISEAESGLTDETQLEKSSVEPGHSIDILDNDGVKKICVKIKLDGVNSVADCDLHVAQVCINFVYSFICINCK